ncbi:MAG: TIGR02449 family protein [Pseudomonadales bacterium]
MENNQVKALEQKIHEIIDLCADLNHENKALKAKHNVWRSERAELMKKNELARSKVENMISRLRALEEDS